MANIWEKAISILAGNLNLGRSYLITTVNPTFVQFFSFCNLVSKFEVWCSSRSIRWITHTAFKTFFVLVCSNNPSNHFTANSNTYDIISTKTKIKTLKVCETAIKINSCRPGQGADGKCGLVSTSFAQLGKIFSKWALLFFRFENEIFLQF